MKLFLSSLPISDAQADAFHDLVGKVPADITVALIENAADVYPPDEWEQLARKALAARGYQVAVIDLREYRSNKEALREKLTGKDVIWLGGGNTFYLRWILKETGADAIIKKLVQNGVVYGGDSAGAIVAGPTLQYFQDADDPAEAPEEIIDGLHLTETVVVPHMDNDEYATAMKGINRFLTDDGYATVPLNDGQALVLYDEEEPSIVPAKS